ncbi:hypothetical protein PHMEG_00034563, partial [Phytophthora megakarya]
RAPWIREWERYVEKIRHRCTTTGETYENVVATVKGCVKRKTLKNLATYVLKKPMVDVSDADIMRAVQARCCTLKNEFVPDVTSLFRQKLKMDLSMDDCDARIFRYYVDFNGIVEDNGLQGLIVLKAQINRLIDFERRDCKSDDDYALKGESKSAKSGCKPPKNNSANAGRKPGPARSESPRPAQLVLPRHLAPPPKEGCLFCKGTHWLADYPTPADTQRGNAQHKYREVKEQRANAVCSKAARYGRSGRTVRINGVVEMTYSPDTGAAKSVVPRGIVDAIREMQPTLQVTNLPTVVEAVMADGRVQLCEQEVLLDLGLTTMLVLSHYGQFPV